MKHWRSIVWLFVGGTPAAVLLVIAVVPATPLSGPYRSNPFIANHGGTYLFFSARNATLRWTQRYDGPFENVSWVEDGFDHLFDDGRPRSWIEFARGHATARPMGLLGNYIASPPQPPNYWTLTIAYEPLILLALAGLTASAWKLSRRWRERRMMRFPYACQGCGYDCRATPLRCPECGRAVVACVKTLLRHADVDVIGEARR